MSARKLTRPLLLACLLALAIPAAAQADFGIQSFTTAARNYDGSVDLRAGSRPFEFDVAFAMNQDSEENPEGTLRDLFVDLPAGFAGNPQALPKCETEDFEGQNSLCPANTQIGVARIQFVGVDPGKPAIQPIYNLTPPLGVAARLGFSLVSLNSFQEGAVNPATDYGLRVSDITIPTTIEIQSIEESIWAVPADHRHDPERQCVVEEKVQTGCSTDAPHIPFISLPTSCQGLPQTLLTVDSLEEPDNLIEESAFLLDENGNPASLTDCEALPFNPTFTAHPQSAAADSPTGLAVNLHLPQENAPEDEESQHRATAHLKDVSVAFPPGLAVNPSAATGLDACALRGPAGINLPHSGPEEAEPAHCPAASKVGTVSVKTPLLDHPLPGSVYLARQQENPFNSLIALYIALDDPISGVVAKIAGKVEPDPITGQLVGSFKQNPQLPFEDFAFEFFGGPRATLTTPTTCGTYQTKATLSSWAQPDVAIPQQSAFAINAAAAGGPCAQSEAQLPNAPAFEAGTQTPLAGTYSPFVMKLSRENGSQHFAALNLTLPKGVSAKFAGLSECSEAQIAAAAARSGLGQGAAEQASPSCPQSSQLGTVTVGAGSGAPFYASGHAYLAGPYKNAPFSVAVITPAVAGPFDLGTVVVRSALYVDEETAQGTIKTDPLPTSLHGIPLDIRSIAINVSRDQFTLNPTSCEAGAVSGEAISTTGQIAPLSNRFQVGGCRGLDFKPKLALTLKGGDQAR